MMPTRLALQECSRPWMKEILVLLGVVLLAAGHAEAQVYCNYNEIESNDSIRSADSGGTIPGSFCWSAEIAEGDEDYFKFSVDTATNVTVRTELFGFGDTIIELLDSNGEQIASNDDAAGGFHSEIADECLQPGQYYVLVRDYSGGGAYSYVLHVSGSVSCGGAPPTSCDYSEVESNDSMSYADTGGSLPGSFCWDAEITRGNEDYFTFYVDTATYVTIRTELFGPGDTVLELLDSGGNQIASNDDAAGGSHSEISDECLQPGQYYVLVRDFHASNTFSYVLHVSSSVSCGPPPSTCSYSEVESNDHMGVADSGGTIPGSFCFAGTITGNDVDYFVFDISGHYTVGIGVELPTGGDSTLAVQDGEGNVLFESDDRSSSDRSSYIEACLAPGRYFVLVQGYGGATFDYQLEIASLEPCEPEVENVLRIMVWDEIATCDAAFDRVIAAFEEEYDVDIELMRSVEEDGYWQTAAAALASAAPPDLALVRDTMLQSLVQSGLILPLSSNILPDDFRLPDFTVSGQIYGAPLGADSYSIDYGFSISSNVSSPVQALAVAFIDFVNGLEDLDFAECWICHKPDDYNNDFASATPLYVFDAQKKEYGIQAYICPDDDQDWWLLPVEAGETVSVTMKFQQHPFCSYLNSKPCIDFDLYVFDSSQNPLGSDLWVPAGTDLRDNESGVVFTATKNEDVRILVTSKINPPGDEDDWSNIPYFLEVSKYIVTPPPLVCPAEPDPPADTMQTAIKLEPASNVAGYYAYENGWICPGTDKDFYAFDVHTGSTDYIDVKLCSLPVDCDLYLYRPNRSLADSSKNSGLLDEHIHFAADAVGTWYVEVRGKGSHSTSDMYDLTVEQTGSADLTIEHIEITQAIQTMDQDVPLMRGQPSMVRVYVGVSGTSATVGNVIVKLEGWSTNTIHKPRLSSPQGIRSVPVATQRLSNLWSFDFILPMSWISESRLRVKATVNPDLNTPETNYNNNTRESPQLVNHYWKLKDVKEANRLRIVPMSWTDPATGIVHQTVTTGSLYTDMCSYLRGVLPDPLVINLFPTTLALSHNLMTPPPAGNTNCGPGWNTLLADLEGWYDDWRAVAPGLPAFVAALIPSTVPCLHGGCGKMGTPRVTAQRQSAGVGTVLAHEMGHNIGEEHVDGCNRMFGSPVGDPNYKPLVDYPTYRDSQGNTLMAGSIGDVGVHVATGQIFNPAFTYDYMTYCSPEWTSLYRWKRLSEWNAFEDAASQLALGSPRKLGPRLASLSSAGLAQRIRLVRVSGRLTEDGAEFSPFWVQDYPAEFLIHDPGNYRIELHDARGLVLARTTFDIEEEGPESDHSYGSFRQWLPYHADTHQVVLFKGDSVLATRIVSASAPTVELLSPNGGEFWEESTVSTIRWSTDDPDGDEVYAKIWYSDDGGVSWIPLSAQMTATEWELDTERLPGSDQAMIRVLATDGFHTVSATTAAPFAVAMKAPTVWILSPTEDQPYRNGVGLLLSGMGSDPESDELPGDALVWTSSIDGELGRGEYIVVRDLTPGVHTITLRGTDPDGEAGEAQVTVVVPEE